MARRRCLGRCGRIIPHGTYCPTCQAKRARRYQAPQYVANRRRVLAESGGRCQCPGCGKCEGDCPRPATEANHIVPGGSHELWNLRAECKSCNSSKRDRGDRGN